MKRTNSEPNASLVPLPTSQLSRRELLQRAGCGFGHLALLSMLADEAGLRAATPDDSGNPLSLKTPHFAPTAKHVIFIFLHGGLSQIESFDPKPELDRLDGKPFPGEKPLQFAGTGNLMKSMWEFDRYGQSGLPVSRLFPHIGSAIDDCCIVRSMKSERVDHGGAALQLHTGSALFPRPSMGSWVLYGLGTENQDLPGFVTIKPTESQGGAQNYGSAFLPAAYQGTRLGSSVASMKNVRFENIAPAIPQHRLQRLQLDLIQSMNHQQLEHTDDSRLEARIEAYELAFRMQATGPEVFDFSDESQSTLDLYGIGDKPTVELSSDLASLQKFAKFGRKLDANPTDEFGRQCLLARRFAERGVRFVQCSHTGTSVPKWDQHSSLRILHPANAVEVDKPIAGLIADLKQRGMLDETLVIVGTEFGRTPVTQGKDMGDIGRDHNPYGYTMLLAGGGIQGGMAYGATDEFGYFARENIVTMYDLHATILHLLGLDHEKLVFPHAGLDVRLTGVNPCRVVHDIVA